ncbi:MAG: L,D-transpeptidase [Bacteriovorax sp.]
MLLSRCKINLVHNFYLLLAFLLSFHWANAFAAGGNFFDTLDPRSPDIEKILKDLDEDYEKTTGLSAHLEVDLLEDLLPRCFRNSCKIWADIDKRVQRLYLYIDGVLTYTWKTSTGREGFETPDFDTHPDGRIYKRYTSTKFPEGDYNGLGNMPFAVFIDGGFAIHGTTRGSWPNLGRPASHGCIRVHPDNGQIFNVLVRRTGVRNVWITIN